MVRSLYPQKLRSSTYKIKSLLRAIKLILYSEGNKKHSEALYLKSSAGVFAAFFLMAYRTLFTALIGILNICFCDGAFKFTDTQTIYTHVCLLNISNPRALICIYQCLSEICRFKKD